MAAVRASPGASEPQGALWQLLRRLDLGRRFGASSMAIPRLTNQALEMTSDRTPSGGLPRVSIRTAAPTR